MPPVANHPFDPPPTLAPYAFAVFENAVPAPRIPRALCAIATVPRHVCACAFDPATTTNPTIIAMSALRMQLSPPNRVRKVQTAIGAIPGPGGQGRGRTRESGANRRIGRDRKYSPVGERL